MRNPWLLLSMLTIACNGATPCPGVGAAPVVAAAPVAAAAPAAKPICPPPTGHERPETMNEAPMAVVCSDVYAEPAMTDAEKESVMHWYADAVVELERLFGARTERMAPLIVCKSEACGRKFSGPTRRSRVVSTPRVAIVITGIGPLAKTTFVHEMIHIEIRRRTSGRPQVPAWFNEGVATYLSDNVVCEPGTKPVIDDLSRLWSNSGWMGFTDQPANIHGAYCQARDEIGAWVARHDRQALVTLIDAVAAGRSFDELYGPMLNPGAPSVETGRSLVARFGFDEPSRTESVDRSGHSHVATLNDVTKTAGRKHQGVKLKNGALVRADGFREYALPDAPFTISLWMKPAVNANVLVHTSKPIEGSGGWCNSLLGYDGGGHLVAQTSFAPDPKSFLTATGPVPLVDRWSHVAVSWAPADGLRLFLNGNLAADAQPKNAAERHRDAPAAPIHLFFGSDRNGGCWTSTIEHGDWNGVLDEVHVYDYALTPPEIADDMKKL